MKLSFFILLRFLKRKNEGRSATLAGVGLLSVIFSSFALLVTVPVVQGFLQAYEQAVLAFNAHIIVMSDESTPNLAEVRDVLEKNQVTNAEIEYWKDHRFSYHLLNKIFGNKDSELHTEKNNLTVGPSGASFFRDKLGFLDNSLMDGLSRRGVVGMSPFFFREALALLPGEIKGVVLKAVDVEKVTQVYPLAFKALDPSDRGRVADAFKKTHVYPPIILGVDLYKKFFVRSAEKNPRNDASVRQVRLMIARDNILPNRVKDYAQTFEVVGTFESGLYEFDSEFVLTSIDTLRPLFNLHGDGNGMEVMLDDPDKAPFLAHQLESQLPAGFQVISWNELNAPLFSAMKLERSFFIIVMLGIVLIGSFNIIGIILMTLWSKKTDMALLSSLGFSSRKLKRLFSFYGLIFALLGTGLGALLAYFTLKLVSQWHLIRLDPQIYFVSELPVSWSPILWFTLIVSSVVLCYFTALFTARYALRQEGLLKTFR